jgi:hypothetical protein
MAFVIIVLFIGVFAVVSLRLLERGVGIKQ